MAGPPPWWRRAAAELGWRPGWRCGCMARRAGKLRSRPSTWSPSATAHGWVLDFDHGAGWCSPIARPRRPADLLLVGMADPNRRVEEPYHRGDMALACGSGCWRQRPGGESGGGCRSRSTYAQRWIRPWPICGTTPRQGTCWPPACSCRVRRPRGAVGAPGHHRARLARRRPLRLHPARRHRGGGAHAGAGHRGVGRGRPGWVGVGVAVTRATASGRGVDRPLVDDRAVGDHQQLPAQVDRGAQWLRTTATSSPTRGGWSTPSPPRAPRSA